MDLIRLLLAKRWLLFLVFCVSKSVPDSGAGDCPSSEMGVVQPIIKLKNIANTTHLKTVKTPPLRLELIVNEDTGLFTSNPVPL